MFNVLALLLKRCLFKYTKHLRDLLLKTKEYLILFDARRILELVNHKGFTGGLEPFLFSLIFNCGAHEERSLS